MAAIIAAAFGAIRRAYLFASLAASLALSAVLSTWSPTFFAVLSMLLPARSAGPSAGWHATIASDQVATKTQSALRDVDMASSPEVVGVV